MPGQQQHQKPAGNQLYAIRELHAPQAFQCLQDSLMLFNCQLNHSEAECQCYAKPGAAAQSLDELEFVRSACHAAQTGQLEKLERILCNRPDAVNSDGGSGMPLRLSGCCILTSSLNSYKQVAAVGVVPNVILLFCSVWGPARNLLGWSTRAASLMSS